MEAAFPLLGDAVAVGHCGGGSKGPARAAGALVPDFLEGGAMWPFRAGVEFLREAEAGQEMFPFREFLVAWEDAAEVSDMGKWGFGVEVQAGLDL